MSFQLFWLKLVFPVQAIFDLVRLLRQLDTKALGSMEKSDSCVLGRVDDVIYVFVNLRRNEKQKL